MSCRINTENIIIEVEWVNKVHSTAWDEKNKYRSPFDSFHTILSIRLLHGHDPLDDLLHILLLQNEVNSFHEIHKGDIGVHSCYIVACL